MEYLSIEVIRKPCAFVLHIQDPIETLKKLAMFFQERHILIDNMQMHRYKNGEAMLIVHCQIEKDRITRTVQLLEQLPGIMELERMEGK
jgi:glycine cleavage system regulatory protein